MLGSTVWSSNEGQHHAHALQSDIVNACENGKPQEAFQYSIHVFFMQLCSS